MHCISPKHFWKKKQAKKKKIIRHAIHLPEVLITIIRKSDSFLKYTRFLKGNTKISGRAEEIYLYQVDNHVQNYNITYTKVLILKEKKSSYVF